MDSKIKSVISPEIYPNIEELVLGGKRDICSAGNIRITNVQSGRQKLRNGPSGDRFRIVIPYAGHSVTWEVVFFGNSSEYPPDFLFDDSSFNPELNDVESLVNWNNAECRSELSLVVYELIEMYRKHQVSLIEQYSRIQLEYTALVDRTGFSEKDIEVYVHRKQKNGQINFLIRLPVKFADIPPILTERNPGEDSALLLVTFQSPEGSKIVPQLFLSPRIEESLGGAKQLRIPSYPNSSLLVDYVQNISELLQDKVDQVVVGFEKRKEYVASFLSHFGRCVLEYDTIGLSKLAFLFEWNDFYFILHIKIPHYFPQDCPVFIFQSIYHSAHGQPYTVTCNEYPYSPRWNGQEMAERARSYILDYIPSFQKNSIRSRK